MRAPALIAVALLAVMASVVMGGVVSKTKHGAILWERNVTLDARTVTLQNTGVALSVTEKCTTAFDVKSGRSLWTLPVPLDVCECHDLFTYVYPNNTLAVFDITGSVVMSYPQSTPYDVTFESCTASEVVILFSESNVVITVPRPLKAPWRGAAMAVKDGSDMTVSLSPFDGSLLLFAGDRTVQKYNAAGALVFTSMLPFPLRGGIFTPDGAFYYALEYSRWYRPGRVAVMDMTSGAVYVLPAPLTHMSPTVIASSPNLLFMPQVQVATPKHPGNVSVLIFDLRARALVAQRTVPVAFERAELQVVVSGDKVLAISSFGFEAVVAAVDVSPPHKVVWSKTNTGSNIVSAGANQFATLSFDDTSLKVYNTTTLALTLIVPLPQLRSSSNVVLSNGGGNLLLVADTLTVTGVAV